MLKILLLKRSYKKKRVFFIVVLNSHNRVSNFIEKLGMINFDYSGKRPVFFRYNKKRLDYWVSKGAHLEGRIVRYLAKF